VLGTTVRIKLRRVPGVASDNPWQAFPEFDDLVALTKACGLPLWEARQRAVEAYQKQGAPPQ